MTTIIRPSSGAGSKKSISRYSRPSKKSQSKGAIVGDLVKTEAERRAEAQQSLKAPSSQFRDSRGARLLSSSFSKPISRAEFQRALALKQKQSRDIRESSRKFIADIQKKREKSGATQRRARIDAIVIKQRLVKEIKGQPLTDLGKAKKQAVIDYIDSQFEPVISGKALWTPGFYGKVQKNLDIFLRKKGVKAITAKKAQKPQPFFKKTISAAPKEKGLGRLSQKLSKQRNIAINKVFTSKSQIERTFNGIVVLGGLGLARGVVGFAKAVRNPVKTAKEQFQALRYPMQTIKALGQEFTLDPVGVVAEFYAFSKTAGLAGKGVKNSPVGRYVQEELFIRSQPVEVQNAIRKILKAARVQQKINPLGIKTIKNVNFLEVASLNAIEAEALARALRNTDSVVFGSWAARTLGGKKLPKPKDVDIATADAAAFNREFIKNLPKPIRKNYVIKGQKIYRRVSSAAEASDKFGTKKIRGAIYDPIFDVKPLSRLIPQKSLLTGRGSLPVVGYVNKIKGIEAVRTLVRISKELSKLNKKLSKASTRASRLKIRKAIKRLEAQRRKALKGFKPSEIAKIEKKAGVGNLEFPTQKIQKIKGIKVIGFGEQTVRKALGTLQVLIEKNSRRAKDPASLVRALEVQRSALKASKKLTLFKKRKLKTLSEAIRLLKSKSFAKLLEKKVPGLTKEYPLVSKINAKKLRKVKFKDIEREVLKKKRVVARKNERKLLKKETSRLPKSKKRAKKRVSESRLPKAKKKKSSSQRLKSAQKSRLPKSKKRASRLPSKLPKKRSSKLKPSKLKKSKASRLKKPRASKLRPSKLKKAKPSKLSPIKPSKLKPSKLKPGKPSRLIPSKLKGKPSRLLAPKVRSQLLKLPKGAPRPPPQILKRPKDKKEEIRVIKWLRRQPQIYRASLAAVLFNITGIPKKRLTGFEIRVIPRATVVRKKTSRKKPKKRKSIKRSKAKRRVKKK